MIQTFICLLLLVSIQCFPTQYPRPPFTHFTERDKHRLSDVNKIPEDLALKLWDNYHYSSDDYYLPELHNNMVHLGYKSVLDHWNKTIQGFYSKHGRLPKVSKEHEMPHYLLTEFYNENQTFYENLDTLFTKLFFEKDEYRMGTDVFLFTDVAEVLWIAVMLERRILFHTFYNSTVEVKNKRKIYSVIKRMALFYYPTHREADKAFDAHGKPRPWEFKEYHATEDDIYLPAEDFFEIYENNFTNICPITENYLCNTFFPLYETEGMPCYCAVVEPFDIDPRFPSNEGCMRDAEFYTHQYISLTISSFVPRYLAPTNAYGLSFGELLATSLVNATSLPAKFQQDKLLTNPTVIFRLHCSALMQQFTIQFAVIARKFTNTNDNVLEQEYLFLAPKRFWEEVEDQNVLHYVENMGIKIIRYGIVDNLTNVEEPNSESPFPYQISHELQDDCRLPETENEFKIFHFVVFQNNCPHLHLAFWKSTLLTWAFTFAFIYIAAAAFATCFQKYRWMLTFGRFKRALRTEYAD